jgi:hypothetical protein
MPIYRQLPSRPQGARTRQTATQARGVRALLSTVLGVGSEVGSGADNGNNTPVLQGFEGPSEPSDSDGSKSRNAGRIDNISNVPESDIQKVMRGATLAFGVLIGFTYLVVRRWLGLQHEHNSPDCRG